MTGAASAASSMTTQQARCHELMSGDNSWREPVMMHGLGYLGCSFMSFIRMEVGGARGNVVHLG